MKAFWLGVLCIGCGGKSTPTPAAAAPAAAPVSSPEPESEPAPAPVQEAAALAIDGAVLAEVTPDGLIAAFTARGFVVDEGVVGTRVCGDVETLTTAYTRDEAMGFLSLMRPATTPDPACSPTSAKESYEVWLPDAEAADSTTAMAFDGGTDTLLVVNYMGLDRAAADALLTSLLEGAPSR